jgi:hypothetical protein
MFYCSIGIGLAGASRLLYADGFIWRGQAKKTDSMVTWHYLFLEVKDADA